MFSKFITLTGYDHKPLVVNAARIMVMSENSDGKPSDPLTDLYLSTSYSSETWIVRESLGSVKEKIEQVEASYHQTVVPMFLKPLLKGLSGRLEEVLDG